MHNSHRINYDLTLYSYHLINIQMHVSSWLHVFVHSCCYYIHAQCVWITVYISYYLVTDTWQYLFLITWVMCQHHQTRSTTSQPPSQTGTQGETASANNYRLASLDQCMKLLTQGALGNQRGIVSLSERDTNLLKIRMETDSDVLDTACGCKLWGSCELKAKCSAWTYAKSEVYTIHIFHFP